MTTGPDHERWEDAAGSYVLGALPDDERAGYEAHLETCPTCRAEVEELRVAAEALPVSPPPMLPPPALKARIMAEVEREAALLASAGEPRTARRAREARAGAPSAAARSRCRARRSARWPARCWRPAWCSAACCSAAAARARSPFQSTLPQASAELEISDDGAILVANGLPAPPDGQDLHGLAAAPRPTRPSRRRRSSRRARDGSATASVTGDLDGVESVLINTEPVGGSPTPTSAARPDRRAHLTPIASRPRTSSSSANSKRSSASPAVRSPASRVSVGNCSGGSEAK